ncbi:transposase family protein [Micromonospora sp. NPDC093243]|uniref:transposase family protein n=1 Tax=Micromonospora sp. NPDC093243 TaxID=3364290 RepID=UPI003814D1C1
MTVTASLGPLAPQPAQQQALMALAHLPNGDTLARLAASLDMSVTATWRYLRHAVDLILAPPTDNLAAAMRRAARLA